MWAREDAQKVVAKQAYSKFPLELEAQINDRRERREYEEEVLAEQKRCDRNAGLETGMLHADLERERKAELHKRQLVQRELLHGQLTESRWIALEKQREEQDFALKWQAHSGGPDDIGRQKNEDPDHKAKKYQENQRAVLAQMAERSAHRWREDLKGMSPREREINAPLLQAAMTS